MFDGHVPSREEILALTFEQMLRAGCEDVVYRSKGGDFLFASCHKWFEVEDLRDMISGMPRADSMSGRNATRIETIYRYLFKSVSISDAGEEIALQGDATFLNFGFSSVDSRFRLILGGYGRYNWDEIRTYHPK